VNPLRLARSLQLHPEESHSDCARTFYAGRTSIPGHFSGVILDIHSAGGRFCTELSDFGPIAVGRLPMRRSRQGFSCVAEQTAMAEVR
jgi:hypothetical protein